MRFHDLSISYGGLLATVGFQISSISPWLTICVGLLTAIYTVLKIVLLTRDIRERKKYEDREREHRDRIQELGEW